MIGSFGAPSIGRRVPPNSVTRKSALTSSQAFSVSHCAPYVPSASSSATAEKMSVPFGRKPCWSNRFTATAIEPVTSSMSTAPRPHTSPSMSSPPKGSCFHPDAVTGTTSVWPMKWRDRAFGSLPSMRRTRLARPGCGS